MKSQESPYRLGVISDTHGYLNPRVFELFAHVNLILHAGDIGNDDILIELESIAPVKAVSGNVDGPPLARQRPLSRELETPVGRIALTHGHHPAMSAYDPADLVAHFDAFHPDIVIHGHTHVPLLCKVSGVTVFNPGAAGRSQVGGRIASVGLITARNGESPVLEHIEL